ncbi:HNH endonuclease signature motif containing protein [Brevibacterium salitolerans]|uniref:HNH nuclease domain-containing protein n=1 Tax=Brevibacterium salitolerans TaxID=1403566 RepID=A0ABP5IVS0_9MICO
MVTVPVLHLLTSPTSTGEASTGEVPAGEVPAELTGLAPIPADAARQIVSTQSVLYRILTDPLTGTVLDETAQTYTIPANVRRTVTAKHEQCAAPGCTRTALRCQADHILPFNHLLPTQGGLTVPENLQPLCQPCHQLKTQGLLTVKKDGGGVSRWSGPLGRESVTLAPPSPHEVQAAVQLQSLLHGRTHDSGAADESTSARKSSPSVEANEAGTTTAAGAAAGVAAGTGLVGITEPSPGNPGVAVVHATMGGSGAESRRTDDTGAQSASTRPAIWRQDEAPPF